MNIIEMIEQMTDVLKDWMKDQPDSYAAKVPLLIEDWLPGKHYKMNDRVSYMGVVYKCTLEHDSQEGWVPSAPTALWAKLLTNDDGSISAWEQPGSTNCYKKGDKVSHKGKVWISIVDNNSWEPGVYGWEEVKEG